MKPFLIKTNRIFQNILPYLTICIVVISLHYIFEQRTEIKILQFQVAKISANDADTNLEEVMAKLDELDTKIGDVESSLSSDIEDVNNNVQLYSQQ